MKRILLIVTPAIEGAKRLYEYKNGWLSNFISSTNKGSGNLASKRLRIDIPFSYLKNNSNYSFDVFMPTSESSFESMKDKEYTHILLGKITKELPLDSSINMIIKILKYFKNRDVSILADYCDCISNNDIRANSYLKIMPYLDTIAIASNAMRDCKYIKNAISKNISVKTIDDPIEVNNFLVPREPKNKEPYKIITYGNNSSYLSYKRLLPTLINLTNNDSYKVEFITVFPKQLCLQLKKEIPPSHSSKFKIIPWKSINELIKILKECHIAFLPSNKWHASSNRITLAIASGLIPVASSIPSFLELNRCSVISQYPEQRLLYALNEYNILARKVIEEQSILEKKFSVKSIASKWDDLFTATQKNLQK